jgi:DNA-binding NtrC family response regulator
MAVGILIIEDEEILAKNIKRFLERHGYDAVVANTAGDGLRIFDKNDIDVVLLDINLPDRHGLEVHDDLRRRASQVVVVCITGYGAVQVAVDAMKAGAADFITKPLALSELKAAIEKTLGQERLAGAVRHYNEGGEAKGGVARLIGESTQMRRLREQIKTLANAELNQVEGPPAPVLIRGETGTGKKLVTRALHLEDAATQCSVHRIELCDIASATARVRTLRPRTRRLHRRQGAQAGTC